MQILNATNISKVYGSKKNKKYRALKDVSFTVDEGEFIGIMGPSGSGKTTLLNILGSIDKLTAGSLSLGGKDVSSLNKKQLAAHRMKNIGFIFQNYNLLESMTLRENIVLPLALNGYGVGAINEKVSMLANDLGITAVIDKYPYEVSGGEQQRAAACRALITDPEIILADEPTGNLDSKSGKQLLNLFEHINQKYNSTIIMVTHDVFAASYCHKILFIRDGEIYNQMNAHESRKDFFDAILNVMSMLGGESDEA